MTTSNGLTNHGPGPGPSKLYGENLKSMKRLFREVQDILLFNGDFRDVERSLVRECIADLDEYEHVKRANVKPIKTIVQRFRQSQAQRP